VFEVPSGCREAAPVDRRQRRQTCCNSSVYQAKEEKKMIDRIDTYAKISNELDKAYEKHGSEKWGRHEFYAVLKEEVDEVWDAIKGDEPMDEVVKEALQVAAVVFRYLETGDRYNWTQK
jgi:NTP pyrophosphatase (non-canonical NTP hydrolase)